MGRKVELRHCAGSAGAGGRGSRLAHSLAELLGAGVRLSEWPAQPGIPLQQERVQAELYAQRRQGKERAAPSAPGKGRPHAGAARTPPLQADVFTNASCLGVSGRRVAGRSARRRLRRRAPRAAAGTRTRTRVTKPTRGWQEALSGRHDSFRTCRIRAFRLRCTRLQGKFEHRRHAAHPAANAEPGGGS